MKKIFAVFGMLALISLSGVLNAQVPMNGLVGYWPFNSNANDESGNNNNGTVNGAILTTDRFGNVNSAYSFNGTNSYIDVPNSTSLDITDSITLSAWVYITDYSKCRDFIGKTYTSSPSTEPYSLYGNTAGKLVISSNNAAGFGNYRISASTIPLNQWVYVSGTITGSEYRVYINGQDAGNSSEFTTNAFDGTNTHSVVFGKFRNSYYLSGSIDDIRIYNRALNPSEITELYLENTCSDTTINDTTIYYVSSSEFQAISPKTIFENTDSLTTQIGGCDSIIHHYLKFVYNPTFCSVTDTLIIDVTLTGIPEPSNINIVKIYPNPAKTFVIINTGNYSTMSNYTIRIENMLGQLVYQTLTNQQEFQIDVNNFGGYGTYIVKIIDSTSNVITTRKIILN